MFYKKLTDSLRTLLRIRRQRSLPPPGARPPFGSTVIRNRLKMQLFVPIDDEQWNWLTEQGWRTLDIRGNRRRYYRVPRSAVNRLLHAATAEERDALHIRILEYKYNLSHLQ